ncbi:MAG: aldo/keto reductase [Promicromonosporaceae bacterium]|nr:aldo/keto reductase [Promicromonosporaceae bacterium]
MIELKTYVANPDRYETMPYRRAGRSGLSLPVISLGLWHNFGDTSPLQTQREIARRAFDLGISHFDLANNYGPPPGSAEENFGRILTKDLGPYRDELVISTKAGYRMHPGLFGDFGSRKYLLGSLNASLARMGTDYVDIFYHHRPDPETPLEETMGALAEAVRSGKARYVGVSNYAPSRLREAAAILADLGTPLVIDQPSYSMFNRTIENRADDGYDGPQQESLLEAATDLGVGVIAFSPLQQGLLTNRYLSGSVPADSRAGRDDTQALTERSISDTYLERARGLNDVAAARGQTLAQMAISWILRQPGVTSALVGASSVRQLEDTVGAVENLAFSPEELAKIDTFAVDGTTRG